MARRLWKDFYAGIDGAIFVVDSKDAERFNEVSPTIFAF